MKAVFPGKPKAKLQAVATALWEGRRFVVYISGNALVILRGPNDLLQTITLQESEELESVAISELSGKIATCTNDTIYVYNPFWLDFENVTWSLQHSLKPTCGDQSLSSLSWGLAEEILAAGSHLTLTDTSHEPRETWRRKLANAAKFAFFTPDASFIASTGWNDPLVKIWSRVSVGEDEERFDISYLSHPCTVTSIRWHRRPDQDHHSDTVLYTTSGDNKLRVWAATDHHALQALQLWTEIDLNDCIIPHDLHSPSFSKKRFVFIIDGWDFEATVEGAIQRGGQGEREKHTREHLLDVAYRNPDVCIVLDDQGNMSAWGLERVGCKAREQSDVFNITYIESVTLRFQGNYSLEGEDFLSICNFSSTDEGRLNLLINFFNRDLEWVSAPVDKLFDPAPATRRFKVDAVLTGHSSPIEQIICCNNGHVVISIASDEVVTWSQDESADSSILLRRNNFKLSKEVHLSCLSINGDLVALLTTNKISLWGVTDHQPRELTSFEVDSKSRPQILEFINSRQQKSQILLLLIDAACKAMLWGVDSLYDGEPTVRLLGEMNLNVEPNTKFFPGQICQQKSGEDTVALSVSEQGMVYFWTLQNGEQSTTYNIGIAGPVQTSIQAASVSSFSVSGRVAILNNSHTEISIWSLRHGELEYCEAYPAHDTANYLDWTTDSNGYSFLAVSFRHKAAIYAPQRRESQNTSKNWILVKTAEIGHLTTLPITSCVWAKNAELILAAGNQMFMFDCEIGTPAAAFARIEIDWKKNRITKIHNGVAALNSLTAVYDAAMLEELVLADRTDASDVILRKLNKALKFWTPGDDFSSNLDLENSQFMCGLDLSVDSMLPNGNLTGDEVPEIEKDHISSEVAAGILDTLESINLPYISTDKQRSLTGYIEAICMVENNRTSVDNQGLKYLIHIHLHRHHVQSSRKAESPPELPWREINSAFHSNSQDILVDLTSRFYDGKMLWHDARESGMFMWLTDIEALRYQFEVIARNEYTRTEERNPIDCTLHYLALRKKQVLMGLWRMATWNREQRATMRMLSNNFDDPRWKTAAQKNAYALLSLRRFEYAAAFFLLAGSLKDAVNVLVSQVKDIQLAVTVVRVYEGDDGPILRELLQDRILPQAAKEGNRHLACWAFWLLGQKQTALRSLAEPLESIIALRESVPMYARSYINNEPSLAHFYRFLRDTANRGPKSEIYISPKAEWELVMRSAAAYSRMGLDILAVNLVRNWKFSYSPSKKPYVNGTAVAASSTLAEDVKRLDIQSNEYEENNSEASEGTTEEDRKQPADPFDPQAQRKKVVEEPNVGSILDNFDF